MPERLPSHLQLALAAVPVFTNDGKLDLAELESLLAKRLPTTGSTTRKSACWPTSSTARSQMA